MNGFLNKNLKSYAKNWLSSVKYAEMQLKNAVRNQYTNLYAYGANNPVHYIDPDGRFYASYKANKKFKEAFDWYIQKYYEKLISIGKRDRVYGTITKSPLNTTAEDAFAWDEDQAKQYIVTEAGNFAIQVGADARRE